MTDRTEQSSAAGSRSSSARRSPRATRSTVLRNGDEIFPAMLEAIRGATSTVDLMTFVYWRGDIAVEFAARDERAGPRRRPGAAAHRRARRPTDREGPRRPDGARRASRSSGSASRSSSRRSSPTTGCTARSASSTAGSASPAASASPRSGAATPATRREWRDTHLRVEGPAVDGLQSAFIQDWAETGRPLYDDHDQFPEQPQRGRSTVQIVRGSA